MKKRTAIRLLLSLTGCAGLLLSSCSADKDTPTPALPDNTIVQGDTRSKIESVLYTVDEQGSYTFYFSPTRNVTDLDVMRAAGDYLEIVTTAPSGSIDLLSQGNKLSYKNVDISPANGADVTKADLTLQLTSASTVQMLLDIAMKSGVTLQAAYNGACIKADAQTGVTLKEKIFGYFMGKADVDADTNGYYVALTNAMWQGTGTQFNLTSEGYALVLNFYGTPGNSWRDMPSGSFRESRTNEDHTFDSRYSGVIHLDENGETHVLMLDGAVQIDFDDAGLATIEASFRNEDDKKQFISYRGELGIADVSLNVHMPQLDRDIFIDGAYASGIYEGDIMDNGSGLVEITIIDQKGENNEPNGSAMKITLFSKKFTNPTRERHLVPGTYTAATTYEQGTWMPTIELPIMDQYIPMGTYALYDDGTQTGAYAYATSGEIVIRQGNGKNIYTIDFELESVTGHAIRGTFTGDVFLENQANDEMNDGSSTLEADYVMDLSYLPRASCYPQDQIWVPALGGDIPVSDIPNITPPGKACGYQFITIGTTAGTWEITDEYPLGAGKGKLVEGDVIGIELLVEVGTEDKITPGTYPVTPNRYPAQFRPGVCVRGYTGNSGTTWQHSTSAIGYGYPAGYYDPDYMVANGWLNIPTVDDFASIYGGSITVTKAEGGDNWFSFKIDGIDVVKHKVTGTWTGPVYFGGTDTPVLPASCAPNRSVLKPGIAMFRKHKPLIAEQMRRSTLQFLQ